MTEIKTRIIPELGRLLGLGVQGEVYLVNYIHNGILVPSAMKVISKDDVKNKVGFEGEVAILRNIGCHPNIVCLYEALEDEENYYIIYEFLDGETLEALTKQKYKFSHDELLNVMWQLSSAVQYLHSMNIVHRDIKLVNIMVTKRDGKLTYVLIDFGFACYIKMCPLVLKGTRNYLPPEVNIKPSPQISVEQLKDLDVYALGVTFFYLANGRFPYPASNLSELRRMISDPEYIPISRYNSGNYQKDKLINDIINLMVNKNAPRVPIDTIVRLLSL